MLEPENRVPLTTRDRLPSLDRPALATGRSGGWRSGRGEYDGLYHSFVGAGFVSSRWKLAAGRMETMRSALRKARASPDPPADCGLQGLQRQLR